MWRSILAGLALVVACHSGVSSPAPTSPIGADIGFLAGPALAGREAGTAGADSAALFLARRYERLGLRPAFRLRCNSASPCPESYFQAFDIVGGIAHNVATVVDGTDPLLQAQVVVLGAHHDALGRSPTFALDRDGGFTMRPGADDNASGTAGLLELARRFRDRPARRSILIVNFDAEEIGLLGSRVFLDNAPVPQRAITFVVNLDMIGRLRGNHIFIEGIRERSTRALIDSAVATVGMRADYVANAGRSDHATFLAAGIEAVALSTGYHGDYHTALDTPVRINLVGLERVVDFAELIVRRMADR
jgi:hypothetical protein